MRGSRRVGGRQLDDRRRSHGRSPSIAGAGDPGATIHADDDVRIAPGREYPTRSARARSDGANGQVAPLLREGERRHHRLRRRPRRAFTDARSPCWRRSRTRPSSPSRTPGCSRSSRTASDELQALGEVGQAVSSSLDLQEVLTTIVANAARLAGADGGTIYEYDETARPRVHRRAPRAADEADRRCSRRRRDGCGLGETTSVGRAPRRRPSRSDLGPAIRDRTIRAPAEAARPGSGRSPCWPSRSCASSGSSAPVIRRKTPGEFPQPSRRPAPDVRQPVGPGHRERPAVRAGPGGEPRSSPRPASTSRSSWRTCPTSCGRR